MLRILRDLFSTLDDFVIELLIQSSYNLYSALHNGFKTQASRHIVNLSSQNCTTECLQIHEQRNGKRFTSLDHTH